MATTTTTVIPPPSSYSQMILEDAFFGCMFSQQTGNCTYNGVNYTPYAVLQSQLESINSLNNYTGGASQFVTDLTNLQTNLQPLVLYNSGGTNSGTTQLVKDMSTLQSSLGTTSTSISSLSTVMKTTGGTTTISAPVKFSGAVTLNSPVVFSSTAQFGTSQTGAQFAPNSSGNYDFQILWSPH